jgi:cell division protein FtsX
MLLIWEGLLISLLGGGIGILLALATEGSLIRIFAQNIQNYQISVPLMLLALGISALLGIVAGLAAGIPFLRSSPTDALRSSG